MKLIVGLGNPGKRYEKTRHNVGFMVVERLIKELIVSPHVERKFNSLVFYHHESKTIFARPQTFMNESGKAVSSLATYYKVSSESIYIVHDDLDIKLGKYKIQKGKGPKEHKGIESIDKALGTGDYWRVRVGIENRGRMSNDKLQITNEYQKQNVKGLKQKRISGEDYVLQNFTDEEMEILNKVIKKVIEDLMGRLNNHR